MKRFLTFVLCLIAIFPARGSEPTCAETLDACKLAVDAQALYIDRLKLQVKEQGEYANLLRKQRDAAVDAAGGDSSLPGYFWVVIGIAGGVILTRGLR